MTRRTKGVACDRRAAAYMVMMGDDLISVDLDIPQRLDGVFEHDGENPGRNVVLEAKYDGTATCQATRGQAEDDADGAAGRKDDVQGNKSE